MTTNASPAVKSGAMSTPTEDLEREVDELRAALKDTLTEVDDLREEVRASSQLVIDQGKLADQEIGRLRAALTDLLELHEDEPNRPAVQIAREALVFDNC